MNEIEILKPCSSCGFEAHIKVVVNGAKPLYFIQCGRCNKRSSFCRDLNDAIKEWNTRACEQAD